MSIESLIIGALATVVIVKSVQVGAVAMGSSSTPWVAKLGTGIGGVFNLGVH